VFPVECSAGSEESRRDLHASDFLSSPPQKGGLEAALGSTKVVFLAYQSSLCCYCSSWWHQNVMRIPLVCLVQERWRLFIVVLDIASSQFNSCGATSWVHAKLLVCGPVLSHLFHFCFLFFFFVLSICNCYILNEIHAQTYSKKRIQYLLCE
jgi:hypothetical protein